MFFFGDSKNGLWPLYRVAVITWGYHHKSISTFCCLFSCILIPRVRKQNPIKNSWLICMFLGFKVEHYCLKWPPGKVTFWEFYHSGSLLCDQKLTQKALILSIWELRNESLVHVNHPWKCLICSLFRFESGQIYTGQKLFTQSVTHIRYGSNMICRKWQWCLQTQRKLNRSLLPAKK